MVMSSRYAMKVTCLGERRKDHTLTWTRVRPGPGRVSLFSKAGDGVEGALLPIAAFPLEVADVHLTSESVHHLLGEQVVDESRVHAAIVVHQLKQHQNNRL